jgi:hypothetical protein
MIAENQISVHRHQFSSGLNNMAKIITCLTEKKLILKIWCGMSIFVDNHCNRHPLLESQAIREAGRSSPRVRWLAVELLALKRAVGVAVSWL